MPHSMDMPQAPTIVATGVGRDGLPGQHLRCELEADTSRVVVRPIGELDLATCGQLERHLQDLLDVGFGRVVVDLALLSFLDSTGVHLLFAFARRAAANGWTFEVLPGPPHIEALLALVGFRNAYGHVG